VQQAGLMERLEQALGHDRGRGLIVAVSGGSDSVGLLCMLHDLGLRLSVAHLDHGTRGDAAKADADFVAELADRLSLPFHLGHWQPERLAHFESDARKARYAWLAEIARKRGSELVAVGHTRDDQAETILHRILRGTGFRGLAGIPRRRLLVEGVTLIRPMLDVSREEIRNYLASIGQTFREDVTNRDLNRTRNRIRHDLLPKLEAEYNPAIREALIRLSKISNGWDSHLDLQVDAVTILADEKRIVLRTEALLSLSSSIRAEVIRLIWKRAGWPEREMNSANWLRLVASLDANPTRFSIVGGIEVFVSSDEFRLTRSSVEVEPQNPPVSLAIPGEVAWGTVRIRASFDPSEGCEAIDLDRLQGNVLTVRAPIGGDRFEPLGLGGHSRPLNDFFRGRNVPREERRNVPIVCDNDGIVWVVGHRIAERVKRTEGTQRLLYLHAATCD